MKLLKFTDDNGYLRQCWVKDNDTNPKYGIPHNPPDLSELGLTSQQQMILHNRLVESGLITHQDVIRSGAGVTTILRQLKLKYLRQQILLLYKLDRR